MNIGWVKSSLMLVISLSIGADCIYPHHLGFRLKHQQISKTDKSVKIRDPAPHTSSKSKSRSGEANSKQSNLSVVYCFASHCDVECSRECISISRATGRPVPVGKLTSTQAKQRKETKIMSSGSFLKLVTEGLLKKIPLTALVRRLTITEEGRRGRHMGLMQKITRVQ